MHIDNNDNNVYLRCRFWVCWSPTSFSWFSSQIQPLDQHRVLQTAAALFDASSVMRHAW